MRSLAYLLAKFDLVKIFFASPAGMQMKPYILQYLDRHCVRYELRYDIGSTGLQRMRPNAMILHPLPRTVELDKTVDDDPRAMYFRQAPYGLYVRMALLSTLLDNE